MKPISIVLILALASSPGLAGKPPSGPVDPKVAYVILTGPGFELRVTNEDGTGSATLHKSPAPLRFDLAPRAQRQIAISDSVDLKLLTYQVTSSGAFAVQSIVTLYSDVGRLYYVDFSPDGTKIAFAARNGEDLMVYDLNSPAGPSNPAVWVSVPYVWDLAWYKNGAALAYVVPKTATGETDDKLYEITGPGASPTLIYTQRQIDHIDAARQDSDALVLSYNDLSGNAYIGLWRGGGFLQPNLANRPVAFRGNLDCTDTKLVYGAPDKSGSTVWYIRNLIQSADRLYTKTPRVNWVQMWPTCS